MTDETNNQEMRDDDTDYQDLVDEPTMPAVSTPLTATEPQSMDDWRMPPPRTVMQPILKMDIAPWGPGKPQIKPQRYDGTGS